MSCRGNYQLNERGVLLDCRSCPTGAQLHLDWPDEWISAEELADWIETEAEERGWTDCTCPDCNAEHALEVAADNEIRCWKEAVCP